MVRSGRAISARRLYDGAARFDMLPAPPLPLPGPTDPEAVAPHYPPVDWRGFSREQIHERIAAAGQLMCFKHEGFWQPMDTLRDKMQLESLWSANRAPWKSWQ